MGLLKKASALLEGPRRRRNDEWHSRHSRETEVKITAIRKENKPSVPAPEFSRSLLRPRKAFAVISIGETDSMAQTASIPHANHDRTSYRAYQHSTMEVPRPIQLVQEDEEDVVAEDSYDECELEDDEDVDESVAEDMRKLEESFRGISQKYRLINRIGEGTFRQPSHASIPRTDSE